MNKIKIQTGANLSRLLQSTVNIPQAFTELVKNSIQNFATSCSIDLKHPYYGDKSCQAIITDDGQGFDHEKDQNDMSAFDKYFVFGNSYDTTNGQGLRLGQMGIGGKLANDKLSHETNIHWTIETKNVHGKCFLVEYKPSEVAFLNEYSPSIKELTNEECSIKTKTGTKITIVSTKNKIQENSWNNKIIKNELRSFFGHLIPQLEKQGKKFSLILNGESLEFIYKLPGSNIPVFDRSFKYDYYGEERTAKIEFRLSLVYARQLLKNHPLKNIDIISKVKICPFHLSDQDLLDSALDWLDDKNQEEFSDRDKIQNVFSKLVGFVSCDALSEVLDDTGMPAKDLSHHGLRDDHPVTKPFFEKCYKVIIEWIVEYIKLNQEEKMNILDALANEVSSMLAEYFEDEDFSDLWDDEEGEEEEEEPTEEEKKEEEEKEELKELAEIASRRDFDFQPEEEEEEEGEEEEEEEEDKPEPPSNIPPLWNRYKNQKLKKSKRIRYIIIDFGEEEKNLMSRVDDNENFTILINEGNPKFSRLKSENSPFLLALHISELLIREITVYKNPLASPSDTDEAISNFYNDKYSQVKQKSDL
tara:strand:- start:1205 stop:2962 length:1758 start_codon:yes stop_codon:yes gene_type:complete